MTRTAITLIALGALAGCAPTGDPAPATAASGRSCFFPQFVSGFREALNSADGAEQIYVDVGARDTYLFETFGGCHELDFAHRIAFEQRGPGAICDGLDVDLLVPDATFGAQRCPVRMVRKLGDGEEGRQR